MATSAEKPANRPSEELKTAVNAVLKDMHNDEFYGVNWQPKLLDASEFVLTGAVDLATGKVHSGAHAYEIHPTFGCTCPEARIRNQRYCKHFVAIEMQRRVDARMEGRDMPKPTPQDEWEAKVQSGTASEEPALLDEREPEPDDIPDPEAPPGVRETTELAMASAQPTHVEEQHVSIQGHQYTDYPMTIYLERRILGTKIGCTFQGQDDDEVWNRAINRLREIARSAKKAEERKEG